MIAPPDGRMQIEKCPAMRSGAGWVIGCLTRLADLTPDPAENPGTTPGHRRQAHQLNTKERSLFVSQSVTSLNPAQPKAARRNFFDTSALFARNECDFDQAV